MNTYENGAVRAMTPEEQAQHETLAQPRPEDVIEELKALLAATDYKTLKYTEGALDIEEFLTVCAQRADWRRQINELEESLLNG